MSERNATVKFGFILALLVVWTSVSAAQPDSDRRGDVQSEIDLRYADHREVTAPLVEGIDRYMNFIHTVFEPALESHRRSTTDVAQMIDVPPPLRRQMIHELKQLHGVAQLALNRSESYSRFKRDGAECGLWVEVIQYYVDGLHTLIEEMSRSDVSASAFAGMTMNQVSTAFLGISSLHPAVLPCFLEKGQYFQGVIPMVRDKAEELRGLHS